MSLITQIIDTENNPEPPYIRIIPSGSSGMGYTNDFVRHGYLAQEDWSPWFFLLGHLVLTVLLAAFMLLLLLRGRRWSNLNAANVNNNGDRGSGHGWVGSPTAEQTLSDRFAKGNIDESEYRERLEILRVNRANQHV